MITKLYTHRNLRPFNSIVVENPTIPNYSLNFVPAHCLLLQRCWKQYLGRYIKTFNIFLEIKPGENIMTHFRVYALKYDLQRKFGLYAALSIAVLVYNQFATLFTPPRKIHCIAFKRDVDINAFPCYYAQQFFIACLTGNTFLDLHKLILNRQGCFIIQQCLLTITLYLFTNKLSEYCVANLSIFDLL